MFCLFIHLSLSFLFPAASPVQSKKPAIIGDRAVNESFTFTLKSSDCPPEDSTIFWKSNININEQQAVICKMNQTMGILPHFYNRIKCNSDFHITLNNLRMDDSGIYTLSYTFPCSDKKHIQLYNLTVYEPVPAPHIEAITHRNSACWCNFTLYCSVPTNSSVERYHWQKGNNETGYQLYRNGCTIHVSLPSQSLGPLDEEFICTVSNPANQNSRSFHVKQICSHLTDGEY
uniref:Ig-like domain-containing protein n=1 Tax=Xenopus tropicalis TaxID=8364 RepID=A0A803JWA1_XENTR